MTTLILCGYTESESPQFLEAEHALLDEIIVRKNLGNGNQVHTLRLKGNPASTPEQEESLSRELIHTFGLDQHKFQTERLCQGDIPFLAIYVANEPELIPQTAIAIPAPKATQALPRIRWRILALVLGVLALLTGIYYGVGFLLVRQINTHYANGNCNALLPLAQTTKSIYPTGMAPFVSPALGQMRECGAYLTAVQEQEAGAWEQALTGYEAYLAVYPAGIKVDQATDGAADTLLAWANEQYNAGQYDSALDHLFTLLSKYKRTSAAANAKGLVPPYYLAWAEELRAAARYAAAEDVLKGFQEWASKNGSDEDRKSADMALAWVYYYWAGDMAASKDYENAVSTYETVLDLEPAPKASDGPSALTEQELPDARVHWADELITNKDFEAAIEQYELAISATTGAAARSELTEKVARTYIRWADSRMGLGDFWGAFERLDTAERKSRSEAIQQQVEEARTRVTHEFSISQSLQARTYMADAALELIENEKTPELPIFGINSESVHIYPYFGTGVDLTGLAADILPKMPAEMHYVAYVTEESRVVQTCTYYYVSGGGYAGEIRRHRVIWVVKLINVQTGKTYQTKELAGTTPVGCPYSTYGMYDIWGQPPDKSDLETWLRKFVK